MHFAIWNIRGFNKSSKHSIVKHFIQEHKLSLIALLETKIPENKLPVLARKIANGWHWISNVHEARNCRIWILWDNDSLIIHNAILSEQYITLSVESRDGKFSSICTFVYALNQMPNRRILWRKLLEYKHNVSGPWIIGGDFNTIASYEEKIGGLPVLETDTEDFQSFLNNGQLINLNTTGFFFTWSNKQDADSRIRSRLDRCLINEDWLHLYTSSQVEYLLPKCSDHSPALISIAENDREEGIKPFKFFNMWVKHPDYLSTVKAVWEQNIEGYKMFQFHTKLRKLKTALKNLNKKHFMNISVQVCRAKDELEDTQRQLSNNPFSSVLIAKEKECIKKYESLLDCEYSFFKQKANINWCIQGDKGSKLFHSAMKKRRHANKILSLQTEEGVRISDKHLVIAEITGYFKNLLGYSVPTLPPNPEIIANGPLLSTDQKLMLSLPVTREEIKKAIFLCLMIKAQVLMDIMLFSSKPHGVLSVMIYF
ncbi:uncharacterized protein LOC109845882 [Asparagus officinalis]|uniref:uncharacterized protein LOC109845882 n=1 Tax=Asparagus officinalis TaxID=4686 RepID=UPI00098DE3C5|nr:uncharacterized protein LOC109845882 [Asparagus officinalis]